MKGSFSLSQLRAVWRCDSDSATLQRLLSLLKDP